MARAIDDPVLLVRAMGELLVSVLAMHMTPLALKQAAWAARAVADDQERLEAAGVAIHGANREHDPDLARAVADFYDLAQMQAMERLTGEPGPVPSHPHPTAAGVRGPGAPLPGLR